MTEFINDHNFGWTKPTNSFSRISAVLTPHRMAFHIRRSRTLRSKFNWDRQREVFPQDRSNHWKPDRGENQTDVAVMWNSRNAVPSAGRTNCAHCSQGWRNQMAMENQRWVLAFLMAIIHQLYKQCQWRWRNSLTLIFHIWYEKPEWRSSILQTPPQTTDLPIYANWVITAESKISNIISTCIINLHTCTTTEFKEQMGHFKNMNKCTYM